MVYHSILLPENVYGAFIEDFAFIFELSEVIEVFIQYPGPGKVSAIWIFLESLLIHEINKYMHERDI